MHESVTVSKQLHIPGIDRNKNYKRGKKRSRGEIYSMIMLKD